MVALAAALPLAARSQALTQPATPPLAPSQAQPQEQPALQTLPSAPAQGQAQAQPVPEAQRGLSWRFTPSIGLTETWSDNTRQVPDASAQAGWITTLIPGLSLEHRGAALRISADYQYQHDFYSGSTGPDASRNYLTALATYDLIERRFWLEGRANITQERLSAFGAAVIPDAPGVNGNRIETRNVGLSPVLRGSWGDFAEYMARANASTTRAQGAIDTNTGEFVATMRSGAPAARLGWLVDASGLATRSDDGLGTLYDFRTRFALVYAPMPQVHVSLIAGYEETDFAPEGDKRQATPGIGLEWSPGARTQFAGVAQHRFFGTGHLATLSHRTARTNWVLRSRRDATTASSAISGGALTLENLMADLLAASIPDPVARTEAVRRRLTAFGSQPTTIGHTFLTERPYLLSAVDATVVFLGVRNTVTFTGLRQTQTALLSSTPPVDDSFADSSAIRTNSYNVSWNYALTPLTSLTASANRLKSVGLDATAPSTNQEFETVYLSTRLGPRTTASFGVRRTVFESTRQAENYKENAVFGSISFRL